jgi:hypothetical protein
MQHKTKACLGTPPVPHGEFRSGKAGCRYGEISPLALVVRGLCPPEMQNSREFAVEDLKSVCGVQPRQTLAKEREELCPASQPYHASP